MARTIAMLSLVLLAASAAGAAPVAPLSLAGLPALPLDAEVAVPVGPETEDLALPMVRDVLPSRATDEILAQAAETAALADCRLAVRLDMAAWAYDVTDHRTRDSAFLTDLVETRTVERLVPVTAVSEEVVWQAGGLLGFLEPVTRTVTEVVGYRTETQTVVEDVATLRVDVAWREDHLEVTPLRETAYLALPIGLPLVAAGQDAAVAQLCDAEVDALAYVPSIDCSGYDGCSPLPLSTGWYARLTSLDVRLAGDADDGLPMRDTEGWTVGTDDLHALIDKRVEEKGLAPAEETEARTGDTTRSAPALHSTTSQVNVPLQSSLIVGIGLALATGFAAVGATLARMRR